MAGPLQVGDVVNLARLAWDVYQYGWSDDHNASEYLLPPFLKSTTPYYTWSCLARLSSALCTTTMAISCARRSMGICGCSESFEFVSPFGSGNAKRFLARQYTEFGRDVRTLASSLKILNDVVTEADSSLRKQGINGSVRWDHISLLEIIGDYEGTLRECLNLLRANERYRVGSNPLRNLEWNVLVQPTADQLRQRIVLHNHKINHVLKPFEMCVCIS